MPESSLRVRAPGLIAGCVSRLEEMILSGEFTPGQHLPPERQLAEHLGVSRPVIHQSLLDLAAKGLVLIHPRHGVTVCDFRKSGSTAILSTLIRYQQGQFSPQFTDSLFSMRLLIEKETARLSATNASNDQISQLEAIIDQEQRCDSAQVQKLTELDFEFHLLVSISSGNLVYPLIMNSFKNVYTHFSSDFYCTIQSTEISKQVFDYQSGLIQAIKAHDPMAAARLMEEMLYHGERMTKGDHL